MSSNNPYVYPLEGYGSLVLSIGESRRSFYKPHALEDEQPSFSLEVFGEPRPDAPPFILYEWQKLYYSFATGPDSIYDPPYRLKINDRNIDTSKDHEGLNILSVQISFNDEIGLTSVEILDNANTSILKLTTEVYPQKMDYRSDYSAMMADISSVLENLAFDALKSTYKKGTSRLSGQATDIELWRILEAMFDDLIRSINVIRKQPNREIRKTEQVLPIELLKEGSRNNR
ncbi:MAG: DUF2357 domain-containing protein, partial [Bacteroidales bacterium]|nr:DUF2357 domain-containing protein [Bacteroidales bacterium]